MLVACNGDSEQADELKMVDVDFELPEAADVGEEVELKATVTYGDDKVTEADQMDFEYWEENDRDDSTFVEGENNGDGTYTAEVSFEEDGVYEIYAHTTAEGIHTMPKKSITIGDGDASSTDDDDDQDEGDAEDGDDTEE